MNERKITIHIVGAGIMGLSLALILARQTRAQDLGYKIHIYEDPLDPGASPIASGLVHSLHGPKMLQESAWARRAFPHLEQHMKELALEMTQCSSADFSQKERCGDTQDFFEPISLIRPLWKEEQLSNLPTLLERSSHHLDHDASAADLLKQRLQLARSSPLYDRLHALLRSAFPLNQFITLKSGWKIHSQRYLAAMRRSLQELYGVVIEPKRLSPRATLAKETGYYFIASGAQFAPWLQEAQKRNEKRTQKIAKKRDEGRDDALQPLDPKLYYTYGEILRGSFTSSPQSLLPLLERLALNARYYFLVHRESRAQESPNQQRFLDNAHPAKEERGGLYRAIFGSTFVHGKRYWESVMEDSNRDSYRVSKEQSSLLKERQRMEKASAPWLSCDKQAALGGQQGSAWQEEKSTSDLHRSAGCRAHSHDHPQGLLLPLQKRHYYIGALGSKGLLSHVPLAIQAAQELKRRIETIKSQS